MAVTAPVAPPERRHRLKGVERIAAILDRAGIPACARDPDEITGLLIPIGRYLQRKSRAIIATDAPAGMLYSFANDAWLFAENNSGALTFAIRRIDTAIETVTPDATIHADGRITRR